MRKDPPMIILKSDFEIAEMKMSCQLAASTLDMIEKHVKPGISTLELNDICHDFIVSAGAIPAPLNYKGFPKSICTSVNEVVCHGIPNSKQILKDGDIINIDVTTILNGYHGDTSKTFLVGSNVSLEKRKLVDVTRDCLNAGISAVSPGCRLGDIGYAIESLANSCGYSVVKDFVGHGIGRGFHEDPQISHVGQKGKGIRLDPGMVFTIEPMINAGDWRIKILKDGWTAITLDHSISAQFEHTIAIKSDWTVEILTQK
ncbi:MAG: type I methionyl aminopeptidase [Proteobacteria bacterium]|nr:type I methionyl aminopeptidase [Pseudomonadota bacterium]